MHYQSEPLTLWVDRRLVLRASPIQGVGTFAIGPIPAGQLLILTTGGLIITPEQRQAGTTILEIEHCTCNSPICRGTITPDDWQISDLRF